MVIKSKKWRFSALHREPAWGVRPASKVRGHRVALRDSEEPDMETSEEGNQPEPVHVGDRDSIESNGTTDQETDSDSSADDSAPSDDVPNSN